MDRLTTCGDPQDWESTERNNRYVRLRNLFLAVTCSTQVKEIWKSSAKHTKCSLNLRTAIQKSTYLSSPPSFSAVGDWQRLAGFPTVRKLGREFKYVDSFIAVLKLRENLVWFAELFQISLTCVNLDLTESLRSENRYAGWALQISN